MSDTYRRGRPTVGVLAGWQFYWTPTQLSYLAPVFRGINQAAQDLNCNLLLGCGMGSSAVIGDQMRPAWPLLLPDADFIPIGPWNTDGLIVANPLQSPVRSRYLQDLIEAGHPILFIGSGELGPTIAADNVDGISEAVRHLIQHGHQRIAFIAGSREDMDGDSGVRLRAYQSALEMCGLEVDPCLAAYGRHVFGGGYSAMRQILDTGAPFTAVLASNDESALGAMQALKDVGRRIPQDTAIIGFDDRTESAAAEPALSSVRIPLFSMGYRALELIRQQIENPTDFPELVTIPTRLIVRESCGCIQREQPEGDTRPAPGENLESRRLQLAEMVASTVLQTQELTDDEGQDLCERFVDAFIASLARNDPAEFQQALAAALLQTTADGDDAYIWQEAISVLDKALKSLPAGQSPASTLNLADEMLNQARLTISVHTQKKHQQHTVDQRWAINRLSVLTADLLNALDESQVFESLAKHLPTMGIHQGSIVRFEAEGDDPVAWSTLYAMLAPGSAPVRFRTVEFPPDGLFPANQPFNLALLPLVNQRGQLGYVIFDTEHVDLYGAIVQQLAGALNTAQLYREATDARRVAEEANQMKSRFLSTVSHELRTPLNLIVGLSKILLEASDPAGLTEARKDIERIYAQAQHLGGLIGDVLDLASSDAGQLRLTNEYIDLEQTLQIVGKIGRQLAADKGLAFELVLSDTDSWVWGDRTRLRQVVLNLISNAIKFTAHGSIRLQLERSGDSITVSVQDTGLGIPPDEQQVIFDEFRQSERSISRGYGGLGLGLAICKRLVDMHHGTIGVRSTGVEGEGSTFYFTLPTVPAPAVRDPQSTLSPVAEQHILLLTTPAGTSERLKDHLRQRGFEVHLALVDEPATWQTFLATTPPDAVVLDASVTSDRAWSILRTTIGNPAMQGVPVLIYASSQQSGSLLELDLLTKPIRFGELKRLIDRQWPETDGPVPARTILVVDDDANTLEMHARIVQSQVPSSRVLQARNGVEALDILHHTAVDLVLLDLIMPELDGFGVLEAMREQESTHGIPVIVLTGRVLTEADMERLNRGVATVLSKGLFSVDETLAHISAALERTRKLSSKTQRLVRQAMAYLHEHFAEPISRQDIARHVGMAEDHLTHCFRQELGMTPITYLNRYRINQAKLLLKDSDHSITEIALEVGFSDSGYFSRVFRREVSMSPEAYRRSG